jgi:hypothetical protein
MYYLYYDLGDSINEKDNDEIIEEESQKVKQEKELVSLLTTSRIK